MFVACLLSGMAGAFIGVCFMACFIAGANEDRYMESIRKGKGNENEDRTKN